MADPAAEPEERSGKGMMLIMVLGIVGGILLGGAVVYFLTGGFGKKQEAPVEKVEAEAKPKEKQIDLLTVPVRRFAVPLINDHGRVLGYMWVDFVFEVNGPQNQSYVAARVPEIRDALLRDLNDRQTTRHDRPGALDIDLVARRLDAVSRQILGRERLLHVRITNVERAPG
ncbi:MAG: hypothetical protein D6740_06140 [Alphaproteobacteria bacterium]|nr:MAG: hypothetical protein D6740_06140 [Alphaproteobacteria bacterium]